MGLMYWLLKIQLWIHSRICSLQYYYSLIKIISIVKKDVKVLSGKNVLLRQEMGMENNILYFVVQRKPWGTIERTSNKGSIWLIYVFKKMAMTAHGEIRKI